MLQPGRKNAASVNKVEADWLFPQAAAAEVSSPHWRLLFIDCLFLGYTAATAFSPADALSLTSQDKMLMMLENAISLLTLVFAAACGQRLPLSSATAITILRFNPRNVWFGSWSCENHSAGRSGARLIRTEGRSRMKNS